MPTLLPPGCKIGDRVGRGRAPRLRWSINLSTGYNDFGHLSYRTFSVSCFWEANLVQRWLGHAQLATTAIYADAVGEEERGIAARLWA
jgi:integrase